MGLSCASLLAVYVSPAEGADDVDLPHPLASWPGQGHVFICQRPLTDDGHIPVCPRRGIGRESLYQGRTPLDMLLSAAS